MKKIFVLIINCITLAHVHSQSTGANAGCSMLIKKPAEAKDTARVIALLRLADGQLMSGTAPDLASARQYSCEALAISRNINFIKGTVEALYRLATITLNSDIQEKQQKALDLYQQALMYLRNSKDPERLGPVWRSIAGCFHHMGKLDEAIAYTDSAESIALHLKKDTIGFIRNYSFRGHCYFDKGNYRKAYEIGIDAWKWAQNTRDTMCKINALTHLLNLFMGAGLPETSLEYLRRILALYPNIYNTKKPLPADVVWSLIIGGQAFLQLNQVDSAVKLIKIIPVNNTDTDYPLLYGRIYGAKNEYDKALGYFKTGYKIDVQTGLEIGSSRYANEIGRTYMAINKIDSAIFYAKTALGIAEAIPALLEMKNAVGTLTDIYARQKNYERVYYYGQLYKSLNDSLAPEEYRQKLALVQVKNELENQKQHAVLLQQESKIKDQQLSNQLLVKRFLIGGLFTLLVFGGVQLHSNRQKQKINKILKQQKEEIQRTFTELEATQAQLVQREKMASLGELTAGIAHEIQNPLNFVNNFSEVNTELIIEMKEQIAKRNFEEVKIIATDIEHNEEKITYHGKRADVIVKGMLQHSRSGSGKKEPTDINALADEYLRLSYNGLRAKDKFFNATFKTDFDDGIGKLEVVPQDIGRVLLNLYNNAFYAVNERKNALTNSTGHPYQPTVSVSTKRVGSNVEIFVKDNSNGIPQKVVDKIFQPFFTTKPTGQGTGLGLSLSYDIIKAHGGAIKVESKEGEGAEFIIQLPTV